MDILRTSFHINEIQYVLELAGTAFFSVSGALAANERSKPDWFGVTIIGFITSLGGDSFRDVLLGSYPLAWIKDIHFIYAILIGIVFASVFYGWLIKVKKALFLFDSLGIAMFTVLGTEKAMSYEIHPLVAAMMGMFSGVMGGVLRDLLTNRVPLLFKKEIYATACLAGAFVFLFLNDINCSRNLNIPVSMLVIFILRIVAIRFNITLPKFRDEKN